MKQVAIIFDMDGVIVDNHHYHFKSWFAFFEQQGIDMTEQEYKEKVNGRTMKEILPAMLGKTISEAEMEEYGGSKEALYRDLYKNDIKPTPGLPAFLEELQQNNIPRAVATSAPPENVHFTMENTGLAPYFPTIIDASMVTKGKPDPEVYLTAAQKLQMKPENCIVFEDAILGIQAGKNAGMKVVAIATTHTVEELKTTAADLVIHDFTALSLHKLIMDLNL